MITHLRPIVSFAAVLVMLVVGGCASRPPASPELMERCVKLYTLWFRYGHHPTFHHTGQKARAEIALEDCRAGRYQDGLRELEILLQRNRIPVPAG